MVKRILLMLTVAAAMAFAACGGGVQADMLPEETPPVATPAPTPPIPEPEPVIESPPPGHVFSPLTGLYIREEAANRRPFAVVINNERQAMPQSGLMQADIIYEVLAEGSITRLVAIFQDFDAEMIGPIRSTRHYFTYFALDHGAVMVHHGGSTAGYAAIRNRRIPAVDGMRFDGTVFWRDIERRRTRGLEHSSYTSAENLLDIADRLNFDMEARENPGIFNFFEDLTAPAPRNLAQRVIVPFHGNNITAFEYNPEDNLYYKSIFGEPHMDAAVDAQVAVSNVLVKITGMSVIDGDGRRNVVMVGSGEGYLATHGTFSRVTWQRDDAAGPTRWYDEDGEPLTVNRGRTWISVINGRPDFEGPIEDVEYDENNRQHF
ncbi:MAG: DUF3048 domain-containing protein [Clostridiales bacterium]|jgi:hypothetical protein|nr:DUF3048 domain-containing protein [Clostridiales bacterium]